MSVGEKIELIHILTQPKRFGIVNLLKNGRMYIGEVSLELGFDRKVVSFHYKVLERAGLIKTSLEMKEPIGSNPILVRYAELTEKAIELLNEYSF